MESKITVLPGDGIGPEVIDSALLVLHAVEQKFGHNFNIQRLPIGGAAIDTTGVALPAETLEECKKSRAVLVGPVGGVKWNSLKPNQRPERGLLSLRSELGLYAGLFPVVLYDNLAGISVLKPEIVKHGADIMMVREMTGGVYFGEHGYRDGPLGQEAFDNMVYAIHEVERVAKIAFELAMSRGKHVTSVDKENVLASGKLWRATVERVAKNYPEVQLENMLVSTAAATLLTQPERFDVILTTNIFGDILSGTLGAVTGSIGVLPSAEVGGNTSMFAPVHGTAPDLVGKDEANPIGAILSAAMLLSQSLKLVDEAVTVERAVRKALTSGARTKDICGGKKYLSCSRFTDEVIGNILHE